MKTDRIEQLRKQGKKIVIRVQFECEWEPDLMPSMDETLAVLQQYGTARVIDMRTDVEPMDQEEQRD